MMRHRYVVGHYASYRQTKLHVKQLEIIVLKPDFFVGYRIMMELLFKYQLSIEKRRRGASFFLDIK